MFCGLHRVPVKGGRHRGEKPEKTKGDDRSVKPKSQRQAATSERLTRCCPVGLPRPSLDAISPFLPRRYFVRWGPQKSQDLELPDLLDG